MANSQHKKRTPRYDRIFAAIAIIFCSVLLIINICRYVKRTKPEEPETTGNVQISTENKTKQNLQELEINTEEIHQGNLILSNRAFPCQFSSEEVLAGNVPEQVDFVTIKSILDRKPSEIKPYTASDWEVGLDKETALAMDAWFEQFCQLTHLHDLRMIAGYKPESEDYDFHTGRTLTIGIFPETGSSYAYVPEGEYAWLKEHASEYGFIERYPEGKEDYFDKEITERRTATFRYVGRAAAEYITSQNFCLEEFLQEIRKYRVENMLVINSGGESYRLYFVPAEMDAPTTKVPIPENTEEYTISGNNVDGFVMILH